MFTTEKKKEKKTAEPMADDISRSRPRIKIDLCNTGNPRAMWLIDPELLIMKFYSIYIIYILMQQLVYESYLYSKKIPFLIKFWYKNSESIPILRIELIVIEFEL